MTLPDTRASSARQLIEEYRPDNTSFFASPTRTILATGNRLAPGTTHDVSRLDAKVRKLLASYDVPLVLAAIPYDPGEAACVVVPESVELAGPVGERHQQAQGATPINGQVPRWDVGTITARPSRAGYADSVVRAMAQIEAGHLDKVVLARTLDLSGPDVDPTAILGRLAARDPHGYTYAIDLAATPAGEAHSLVGASPELLVARRRRRVVARPEAGSAARSADPEEDVRRGSALLASAKDLAEHAFVVDAVVASLGAHCREVTAPPRPTLVATAAMWHLHTEVRGVLVDPSMSSLALALALHPTPAVCGTPTAAAHAAIGELEPFDRGFYAGVVGWCDASGDGEWAIALRCAELRRDTIRLYAGAGVVAGSDPASEVDETSAKFRTMLDAMGLDHDA